MPNNYENTHGYETVEEESKKVGRKIASNIGSVLTEGEVDAKVFDALFVVMDLDKQEQANTVMKMAAVLKGRNLYDSNSEVAKQFRHGAVGILKFNNALDGALKFSIFYDHYKKIDDFEKLININKELKSKTSDALEIELINNKIKKLEEQINEKYVEMGKSFFDVLSLIPGANAGVNIMFGLAKDILEAGARVIRNHYNKVDAVIEFMHKKLDNGGKVSYEELKNERADDTEYDELSEKITIFKDSGLWEFFKSDDQLTFEEKQSLKTIQTQYNDCEKYISKKEKEINELLHQSNLTIENANGRKIDKNILKFSVARGFHKTKESFDKGSTATKYDPIVIDLNADGKLATTNVKDGVYFDLDNNGFKEKTAWINGDDGLLIMDRDGDGKITSGNELFGDQNILENGEVSSGGFMSLSELDENEDGKIDASDSKFSNLRVWRDFNRNGITDDGELFTLEDVQIESLSLNYQHLGEEDENGNEIVRTSSYKKTDGSLGLLGEFLLDRNGIDTRYDTVNGVSLDDLVISDDIMALPDISSYGTVYTLREAMATDDTGELKEKVEAFVTADNLESRHQMIDEILLLWTGSQNVEDGSRGMFFDAKKLAVLEKVMGQDYVGVSGKNPTEDAASFLQKAYDELRETLYVSFMLQTEYQDIGEKLELSYKVDTGFALISIEDVKEVFNNKLGDNIAENKRVVSDMLRIMRNVYIGNKEAYDAFRNYVSYKGFGLLYDFDRESFISKKYGDEENYISLDESYHIVFTGGGSDTIYGSEIGERIYGESGDDTIYAGKGDDILVGGSGKGEYCSSW